MKTTTKCYGAFRNVGDSTNHGETFEGELKEVLKWLIGKCTTQTMLKRFAIGIGRDEAGALAAVQDKRLRTNTSDVDELEQMLDDLFDPKEIFGEESEPCEHEWKYNGTDPHGSHKGEDAYHCSLCDKIEYR